MCFNIEEHIYGLIIVTLILIILIGCSIYLHKKKNIASNTILSIWSISLSTIAIIVTMVRVDVYFTMIPLSVLWQDSWGLVLQLLSVHKFIIASKHQKNKRDRRITKASRKRH